MLRVYHSNYLDLLEVLIEFIIDNKPLNDPFESEIILVESNGIAQWLKITMSKKFGIAANVNFQLPESFIWDMFVKVLPKKPKVSVLNKLSISWKLMSLLQQQMHIYNELSTLRNYINFNENIDKRKLFKLASIIAELYDLYIKYRPEWLIRWESGDLIEGLPEFQIWQAFLWKALVEDINANQQLYSANIYLKFISTLEDASYIPLELPSRIFICGISSLPPIYLDALKALGKHIDIHLMFTNPCCKYWGDINYNDTRKCITRLVSKQLPNPLLASWGKLGKDYFHMLSNISASGEGDIDVFADISPDCLLHNLQRDILYLENKAIFGFSTTEFERSDNKRLLNFSDRSITIHICHSQLREVEVLHDNILSMLDTNPKLKLCDIIVMVADIDSYSPFIKAVFESTNGDRSLSYTISDFSVLKNNPTLQAFIKLMRLPESNFISQDLLALFDIPVFALKFFFDEHDISLVRKLIKKYLMYWNIENDKIKLNELKLSDSDKYTWQVYLTSMLIDDSAIKSNYSELINKVISLLMLLKKWSIELMRSRKLKEWLPVCSDMLKIFLKPISSRDERTIYLIEKYWQAIIYEGISSHYNEDIPISLLCDEFTKYLDKERISNNFFTGKINICTMMPMRSLPFKVVCMLGMNDGVYPRGIAQLSFNLMSYKQKIGDRSSSDDDRYIFLETLMSAQDKLYISYIGRSLQDNQELVPSILVQELIDYISQSHYLPGDEKLNCYESEQKVKKHITYFHSSMPFDPINYLNNEQQSYVFEWLPAAKKNGKAQKSFIKQLDTLNFSSLDFKQLQSFWYHPVKAFFNMRLQINFISENSNNKHFLLNRVSNYKLNKQLLNELIENKKNAENIFLCYLTKIQRNYNTCSEIVFHAKAKYKEIKELASRVIEYSKPKQKFLIDLNCAGVHLTGLLNNVQKNGLICCSPSMLSISQVLQLWLKHLVYNACGGKGESRLFVLKNGQWCFPQLEKEQALYYLSQLIEGYRNGMNKPLLLFPESGGAWIKICFDQKNNTIITDDIILEKAKKKFFQTYEGNMIVNGEGKDIWYQRLLQSIDPKSELYKIIISEAKRYLLPLFKFNKYC